MDAVWNKLLLEEWDWGPELWDEDTRIEFLEAAESLANRFRGVSTTTTTVPAPENRSHVAVAPPLDPESFGELVVTDKDSEFVLSDVFDMLQDLTSNSPLQEAALAPTELDIVDDSKMDVANEELAPLPAGKDTSPVESIVPSKPEIPSGDPWLCSSKTLLDEFMEIDEDSDGASSEVALSLFNNRLDRTVVPLDLDNFEDSGSDFEGYENPSPSCEIIKEISLYDDENEEDMFSHPSDIERKPLIEDCCFNIIPDHNYASIESPALVETKDLSMDTTFTIPSLTNSEEEVRSEEDYNVKFSSVGELFVATRQEAMDVVLKTMDGKPQNLGCFLEVGIAVEIQSTETKAWTVQDFRSRKRILPGIIKKMRESCEGYIFDKDYNRLSGQLSAKITIFCKPGLPNVRSIIECEITATVDNRYPATSLASYRPQPKKKPISKRNPTVY